MREKPKIWRGDSLHLSTPLSPSQSQSSETETHTHIYVLYTYTHRHTHMYVCIYIYMSDFVDFRNQILHNILSYFLSSSLKKQYLTQNARSKVNLVKKHLYRYITFLPFFLNLSPTSRDPAEWLVLPLVLPRFRGRVLVLSTALPPVSICLTDGLWLGLIWRE